MVGAKTNFSMNKDGRSYDNLSRNEGCSSNVVAVALPMENAAKMNKSRRSISLNTDRIYIHGSSGIPARSRFGHFCSDHWHPLKIVSTVRVAKYRRVARRRTVIARRRVNIIKIFMTSAR